MSKGRWVDNVELWNKTSQNLNERASAHKEIYQIHSCEQRIPLTALTIYCTVRHCLVKLPRRNATKFSTNFQIYIYIMVNAQMVFS